MNKKILFVFTNNDKLGDTGKKTGFYLPEAAHPYYILKDAGCDIDFMSPKGGHVPLDEESRNKYSNDLVCSRFLDDTEVKYKLNISIKPSDLKVDDYRIMFFVGGHGPMWDLPDNTEIQELVRRFYEDNNGILCGVCHGPAGFVNVRLSNGEYLVKGKNVVCLTNEEEKLSKTDSIVPFLLEDRLKQNGAIFHKAAKPMEEHIECDGRLCTGQNPVSAVAIGKCMLECLNK
jgi:putative intracellular protease/amidase